MADVAVDPALAEAGRLDRGDAPVERLGAPGAQRDVAEPGLRRLGQLQAVAEVVAPAAEEDRLALARLLLHAEHVDEEAQALVGRRRQQLGVADAGDDREPARSLLDQLAQAVEVVRERARLELRALVRLGRGAVARQPRAPPRRAPAATTTAPSASSTTTSPCRIVAPPTSTGSPIVARRLLVGAAHAHPARPDRQAELAQLLDVAHGRVDEQRRHAAALRLRGEQVADERRPAAARGIVSTSTSPGSASATAACTIRLSSWPQRTVRAGPADPEPGTIWISEVDTVEQPLRPVASAQLVEAAGRRTPEHRSPARACVASRLVSHSASTTCGVTRWNASAYSIALSPDERRAWLPRRSASCVVVRVRVRLRLHLGHRRALLLDHRRDVDERRRREVAELGLVRLEQEQLGRLNGRRTRSPSPPRRRGRGPARPRRTPPRGRG